MLIAIGLVAVAGFFLLLVVRGSGKANDVAEQQEAALLRQMDDDAALERITR